jgi:putative ABC transport system permease protein
MLHDLRYALRGLARNPGFAAAAILTMTLGIGAVTTLFSVADAALLRPLPYPEQARLVMVWDQLTKLGQMRFPLRYQTFVPYLQTDVFESSAEFRLEDATLTGVGEAARIIVMRSSAGLIPMLGAAPAIGRGFTEAETNPGHGNVAILGHRLFMDRFGGSAHAVGRSIALDGRAFTIIGVMPAGFEFSDTEDQDRPDIWTPLELADDGRWGAFSMIARLRDGVSMDAAQSALSAVAKHLDETQHMYHGPNGEDAGYRVRVVSLRDELLGRFRLATLLLISAACAVLLIALANVSNLLLVRAVGREQEFAVRRAIGASEARLARQWITEGALLAAIGGVLGAIASEWGVRAVLAVSPVALPSATRVSVDGRVLGVTFLIVAIVSIVFGLTPLFAGRLALRGGRPKQRTAPALMAAEVAIAMILLISGSLLLKSFASLRHVDAGFHPEHLLTLHLDLPHVQYPEPRDRISFYSALHDRLSELPGVIAAGEVTRLPANGGSPNSRGGNPFSIEGRPWNPNSAVPQLAHTQSADPDYFRTMQIPILAGRRGYQRNAGARIFPQRRPRPAHHAGRPAIRLPVADDCRRGGRCENGRPGRCSRAAVLSAADAGRVAVDRGRAAHLRRSGEDRAGRLRRHPIDRC